MVALPGPRGETRPAGGRWPAPAASGRSRRWRAVGCPTACAGRRRALRRETLVSVDGGDWRAQRRAERVLRRIDRDVRRRSRRGVGPLLGLLTVVAVVAFAGVVVVGSDWDVGAWLRPRAYVEVDGQPVAVPRPEASDGRLLPAVAATTEGAHAFLHTADDLVMLARPDGHQQARAIVMHELAHVLGLDHVPDADELMNPVSSNRTDLGPGDLQGLALVGQVACEG